MCIRITFCRGSDVAEQVSGVGKQMSTRVQRYIVIKKDKNLAGSPRGLRVLG